MLRGSDVHIEWRRVLSSYLARPTLQEMGLQNYARLFASRGYTCISFDYRHFGGSEGAPRQLIDIGKQRQDWKSAIAFARSQDDIDEDQIGIFGSSFGGAHVIVTAAEDTRVSRLSAGSHLGT